MVQVFFMSGQRVPIDLTGHESVAEVRWRVAEALGAPSADNVELLDEAGDKLEEVTFIGNLGENAKVQAFVFDLENAEPGDQDCWVPPPVPETLTDEEMAKFHSYEDAADLNTTLASSDPADSPAPSIPLLEAVSIGDTEAVSRILADGFDICTQDADGETALHRAAYNGSQELVIMLLEARADPNIPDRKGKTPLRKAYDNKDVAERLLSAGSDPNSADKNGNTALHRAAEDDQVEVAKVLLAASADPNLLNDDELSSLHTAAIFGKAGVTALMLERKADINARGADGNTALHFAAYAGFSEVGQMLLKGGADRSLRNEEGETPLEHANGVDRESLVWLS